MGVQKNRTTRRRTHQRRSHSALTIPNVNTCSHCGEPTISHRACPSCGYYKNRLVLPTVEK